MKKGSLLIVSLMLGAFSTSCVAYKIKELDVKAVAAKDRKAAVLGVKTKTGYIQFLEEEPARVKDGAIVGKVPGTIGIHPSDVADIERVRKRARIVMKEGSRFEVLSSRPEGDNVLCEILTPTCIPLDDVLRAKVKVVNTAATVLGTLAGVAIVVAAVALDSSGTDEDTYVDEGDDSSFLASFIEGLLEPGDCPISPRSTKSLKDLEKSPDVSAETEFWAMEWMAVQASPGPDGKYRVPLDRGPGAGRGIDEAKLVVVDHPPGVAVAPDIQGIVRTLSAPVAPTVAIDGAGRDIGSAVGRKDDDLWRSPGGDLQPEASKNPHDKITLEFPRPAGARRAKLVVSATNTMWRSQYSWQSARPPGGTDRGGKSQSVHDNWEFTKLRVQMETVFGWETAQMVFGGGPLAPADTVYGLDLGDVRGTAVRIKLQPPAGYWLIDRLAMDFSEDLPLADVLLDAEAVESADGPDSAEALRALAVEDGTTLFLENPESHPVLTFSAPPLADGMERALFLRTVSCYEMPPRPGEKRSL